MADEAPIVSVCLVTRDRLPFLRTSLAGALAQTHPSYEVIVSDNWSTDGTSEFCQQVAATDPRVRYSRPAEPVGLYANHNAAFARARGRYVSFFHDDDLYRPQLLARFAAFLDEHPRVGVVSSDWDRMDDNDQLVAPRIHQIPSVLAGRDYIERTLRSGRSTVALPGSMLRREAIPDPPFDEREPLRAFTDHVTWFRVAEGWDVGHIPERLWAYRQHRGAGSNMPVRKLIEDHADVFTSYVDEYARRHPDDADRARRWRAAIGRFRFWASLYDSMERIRPFRMMARNIEFARRVLGMD